MVFAYEVLEVWVERHERVGASGQHFFARERAVRVRHDGVDAHPGYAFPDVALFEEAEYVAAQRVVWFQLLVSFHEDDVIPGRREERLAHLSVLERVGFVLEFLQRLVRAYPRQQPPLAAEPRSCDRRRAMSAKSAPAFSAP